MLRLAKTAPTRYMRAMNAHAPILTGAEEAVRKAVGLPAGARVVAAVRGGLLTLDEACERYSLTNEEFLAWQQSIDRHGLAGLRATRLQQYR